MLVSLLGRVGDQGPVELSSESVKLSLPKKMLSTATSGSCCFPCEERQVIGHAKKKLHKSKILFPAICSGTQSILEPDLDLSKLHCCTESPQQLIRGHQPCLALLLLCNGFRCLVVVYLKRIPNTQALTNSSLSTTRLKLRVQGQRWFQVFMLGTSSHKNEGGRRTTRATRFGRFP